MKGPPELVLSRDQSDALVALRAEMGALEVLERDLLGPATVLARLASRFESLREDALRAWRELDHLVLRGVPASDDGATGLLAAALLFRRLRPYRGERIVKRFEMNPWTTALSHTLAEGSFHTDLNTASDPPKATIMQCVRPDPDSPRHGQLRVARFHDVVTALRSSGAHGAVRLLTEDHVVMVNDAASDHWSGRISDGPCVRFHPETLRAGQRRLGGNPADLEESLGRVHAAAMSVSSPIDLAAGDVLVVSNHRALHQRGACTVRFRAFPRDFDTRAVAVLHAMDEPQ